MDDFSNFEFGLVQKCVGLVDRELSNYTVAFTCKNRRRYSREVPPKFFFQVSSKISFLTRQFSFILLSHRLSCPPPRASRRKLNPMTTGILIASSPPRASFAISQARLPQDPVLRLESVRIPRPRKGKRRRVTEVEAPGDDHHCVGDGN